MSTAQSKCVSSDYRLCFTLKQHTPIIHFQAKQKGATLRATELKPKLDRFIKNELEIVDNELYQKYKNIIEDETIFPNDKKGSNKYKINLYTSSKSIENNEGAYFGDSSDDGYQAVKSIRPIVITIKSINLELNELLKKALRYVCVLNNFGTRQNKGYGSFIPTDMNEDEFQHKLLKKYKQAYVSSSRAPLNTIKDDYQILKSGRNIPNDRFPYKKSMLFDYMCKGTGVRWEKRMVKEYMKKNYLNIFNQLKYETDHHRMVKCTNETDIFEYKYIRGLLGIGEHMEFLKTYGGNNDKTDIKIIPENNNIERFASPILFKVFGRKIYVVGDDDISIKGEKFSFQLNGNVLNEPIEIPRNFILSDFLNFAFNQESSYPENLGYQEITDKEKL